MKLHHNNTVLLEVGNEKPVPFRLADKQKYSHVWEL